MRSLPWTLCRGDVEGNVEALRSGPRPSEETSGKIWDLLAMEYPIADIAAGVRLMAECSWTTTAVEQGHSSASSIIRAHPRSSKLAHFFDEKHCKRKSRFARKGSFACSRRGRSSSLADMLTAVLSSHRLGAGIKIAGGAPADYHRRVIKHHGKVWAAMPAEHKQQFHRLARDLQEDRRTCASEKLLKQLGVLRELKEKRSLRGLHVA